MIKVKSRGNQTAEQMIRRFKKMCGKEGLTKDIKRVAYYEKPSEKRRRRPRKPRPKGPKRQRAPPPQRLQRPAKRASRRRPPEGRTTRARSRARTIPSSPAPPPFTSRGSAK